MYSYIYLKKTTNHADRQISRISIHHAARVLDSFNNIVCWFKKRARRLCDCTRHSYTRAFRKPPPQSITSPLPLPFYILHNLTDIYNTSIWFLDATASRPKAMYPFVRFRLFVCRTQTITKLLLCRRAARIEQNVCAAFRVVDDAQRKTE